MALYRRSASGRKGAVSRRPERNRAGEAGFRLIADAASTAAYAHC